jgi:hypothetical protein
MRISSGTARIVFQLPPENRLTNQLVPVLRNHLKEQLPEFVVAHWWEYPLHNQTAFQLKTALQTRPGLVVTNIPQHLPRRSRRANERETPALASWLCPGGRRCEKTAPLVPIFLSVSRTFGPQSRASFELFSPILFPGKSLAVLKRGLPAGRYSAVFPLPPHRVLEKTERSCCYACDRICPLYRARADAPWAVLCA